MVGTAESLAVLVPEIGRERIEEHLARLDRRYFERFSEEEVAAHFRALSRLSSEHPVETIVRGNGEGEVQCTILAFDYPSEFSFITGVLASMSFDVVSGDVFTYASSVAAPRTSRRQAGRERPGEAASTSRRKIIDCFTGVVRRESWSETWAEKLADSLERVILILERGGKDSLLKTKQAVNEMAALALEEIGSPASTVLFPISIEVDNSALAFTRIRVVSQDTPFFLFAFSIALSLQSVSIEHVTIRTEAGRIEDAFEFVDVAGGKIEESARIDRIKLSVLLTKQFTSFLEVAPDPRAALLRFENMVRDLLPLPEQGRWLELLSNQRVMSGLARLLGASTFLWEDFIRLQYETLIPMLQPHVEGKSFCEPLELLPERLELALAGAEGESEFARALNDFKDREIYLYDLDHILNPGSDPLILSRRLTALAQLVVDAAASFAYRALVEKFGEPRTVAGLPVRFAVMGLGTMGGAALGYASDIELLFVYGDNGSTGGPRIVENAEFFDALVRNVRDLIRAKREGIFHVDLRLRPYGASGPLACSLESFCTYYAPAGPAHSYERLSLVRLRKVGGDRALGARIERLRDELVYAARSIDLDELRSLRERQLREKTKPGGLNAKFSAGALVDLEYAVQILQVMHGVSEKKLRTPKIHEALKTLAFVGILEETEMRELVDAYQFFRQLINGLRMLRGSALDLFLPAVDSEEYSHLARRTGYRSGDDMSAAAKLHLDFETHSAEVRAFAQRHFGRGGLLGAAAANAADLVLSETVDPAARDSILKDKGFRDPGRAFVNLRYISGAGPLEAGERPLELAERRSRFARLAILACDILALRPDPDMALNNWERFIRALSDPLAHLASMLSQPMRLEILLDIFSTSHFLADSLVRKPELLDYISKPEVLRVRRADSDMAGELARLSSEALTRDRWMAALRAFRRKEILRIGSRDICLGTPTRAIMDEISSVADCLIGAALERIRREEERGRAPGSAKGALKFCVIAFGKLGGRELNYSSDIDLLGLWDAEEEDGAEERATALMERLRSDLSDHTPEGYAFRVDLRLRPYGSSGQLVFRREALLDYYSRSAALWELQALLKARPVAGDLDLGKSFMSAARSLLTADHERASVVASIDRLRREALRSLSQGFPGATDVKIGLGGIRDIEFLVQGLQLVHAKARPELLEPSTLAGLEALGAARLLSPAVAEELARDYVFLRRVEHFLQIYEDRQTHSLPRDPAQMLALARRSLGSKSSIEKFRSKLAEVFERVRRNYVKFIEGEY